MRECEKRVGEAGNKGIMLCFMKYFARRWRQFMGLICPHTATSAVCAQLIISLLLEGFLITHQDSDAKNIMKATLFTVKRNACCAFCWSPLHWSEAPNGGHWRLIVPDVEFVLREPGPRHPAGHRQEAGLGPAALQLGRAGGHGRRASQVGSCEKIVQKRADF